MSVEWIERDPPGGDAPATSPAARPRHPARLLAVIGFALVAVSVATGFLIGRATAPGGAAGTAHPTPARTVAGEVVVRTYSTMVENMDAPDTATCLSGGRDSDVALQAPVLLVDGNGTVLGATVLGAGRIEAQGGCAFGFRATVPSVPGVLLVRVGSRPGVVVDRADSTHVRVEID